MKLYAFEEHSDAVSDMDVLVVSSLARVEVPAAIWRKHRIGELDTADAAMLTTAFEADWFSGEHQLPRFAVVSTTTNVLEDAARLAVTHGLRAYDAVQLASAVQARLADPACETFACFDRRLREAALVEGFRLLV